MSNFIRGGSLLLLALLTIPYQLHAAGPYEIDINELEKQKAPPSRERETKKTAKAKKEKKGRTAATGTGKESGSSGYVRYTVKPGDHIFKILMVRFGMSNDEAERLVPEIVRINKIPDIKKLSVGQTLLIPKKGKGSKKQPEVQAKLKGEGTAREVKKPEPRAPEPRTPEPKAPAPRAPESRAPESRAPESRAPESRAPEPAALAPAATAPAATAPAAPSSSAAAPPCPVAPVQEPTMVCSVTEREPAKVVDAVLNALSLTFARNKIVESAAKAATPFSIRVDRYFEYKGERYVIGIGESDPYNYTLMRILESAGYRSLTVGGADDFNTVTEKILRLVGVHLDLGKHPLQGGKDATGFLVQPDDAGGRRVLITREQLDPRQKWVMKGGCER